MLAASPCTGARPFKTLAYPKDKKKYIQCQDEYHYDILSCPNDGEYDEKTNSCNVFVPAVNQCDKEKPCLNDGECIPLPDGEFECSCSSDWTGDRCQTPKHVCAKKPCGPNAECRLLKTSDFEQDYICVCHNARSYGLNCQDGKF